MQVLPASPFTMFKHLKRQCLNITGNIMTNFNLTKYFKSFLILLSFVLLGGYGSNAIAQQFNLGADIMSRYVWRGTDFGNSPSIQPSIAFSTAGFEIGTWGAFPVSQESFPVEEHDLYLSYAFATAGSGTFSLGVTDYYFPSGGVKFFNFDGDGLGAHWIEPFLGYSGPESFPISLYGGIFLHNDPDNSVYLEASYPFALDGTVATFSIGGTPQESVFYGTSKAGVLNLGLSVSRSVNLTDEFSLPLVASYILNPYHQKSFLVFGFSL